MKKTFRSIALMVLMCMLMSLLPAQAEVVHTAVIGERGFATLQEALTAVQAGEVIQLNDDVTEEFVTVKPAVTLDLNGHILNAEYVIGLKTSAVIDSSADNSGMLKVQQDHVALDQTNDGYFPVYDGNGFVFTTVGLQGRSRFIAADHFVFSPVFESFAHEALQAGAADSGVSIVVRLNWISEDNYTAHQDFVYLDKMVEKVIGSYNAAGYENNYARAFFAAFGGSEAGQGMDVQATAVVCSDTGVEIVGESHIAPSVEDALEEVLENKTELRFDTNGQFKAMVFADIHATADGLNTEQQADLKNAVDKEKPNLVIFTGDNIRAATKTEAEFRKVLDTLVGYLEEKGIYWMHVFGNHDHELTTLSKEQMMEIYSSYEHCLSKDPRKDLTGVGNYVVPVYGSAENSDEIKFAFWGIDSGNYLSAEDKEAMFPDQETSFEGFDDESYDGTQYDYIHSDQIEWYKETSKQLELYAGRKVSGLMAFHIPLQELYTGWINRASLPHGGEKGEFVCASAYNSGMFEAMKNRGDIKATVSGHDHKNSMWVEYGGIKLCYSPTISTVSYHSATERGSRVFVINEADPSNVDTYMYYVDGRTDLSGSDCKEIVTGTTFDLEWENPKITATGNHGKTDADNAGHNVSAIKAAIENGVGKDGSKGLAVSRSSYTSSGYSRNTQVIVDVPYGRLGENKYLAVWVDFATNGVEYRKASFGLVKNYDYVNHYETDAIGTKVEYYMMADGSTEWVAGTTDSDGCFATNGFKGWMAFPIDMMSRVGTTVSNKETLQPDDIITSVVVFTSINADENQCGKDGYFDDFTLLYDYKSLGYPSLPDGTTFDFEGEVPTFKVGYGAWSPEYNDHASIYAEVLDGKGLNGSKALALCRSKWWDAAAKQNLAVQWNAPQAGQLGENQYLMVWMDLATSDVDFRKASWGVLAADSTARYCTDDYGSGASFFYKADGSDTWTSYTMGPDGCFGLAGTPSVKGFKGWFAFPTSTLKSGSQTLNPGSVITGYYFFCSPTCEADTGIDNAVYIDNIMLVKDYKTAL